MLPIDKEIIKKKISELATMRDILFYLDVSEKEVNDRIGELYWKTRMNDVGDFIGGENGWEYFFEYQEFNPEYMTYPPLNKDEQKQYLKDYGNEIKEAEDLHNLDYFIKDQKKFYEKQLVKYTLIDTGKERIDIPDKKSDNDLRSFQRGELQAELEPFAKEHNLEIGESVQSKKVRLITRKLIEKGWDAKTESVAEAFRKMGFVKGRRK